MLILRLSKREDQGSRKEQALFNLEIKKKSGSSITPDIHHSKVPSSDQLWVRWCPFFLFRNAQVTFVETPKNKIHSFEN